VVRARSSLGAAVAAVALASGAVVGAAPASAAVAPPGVKVTLKDGHVRLAPDTLRPGLYRFAVEVPGGAPDGLQLVRPRAGYSAAEFARYSDLVSSGTPTQARRAQRRLDANARMWGGLVVDGPATENFWQSLPAGRVFLVSQRRPREVRVVRVTGERRRTSVPGANAVIDVADGAAALFLDPGTREWLHYDLSAGSYALICYQLELETFEFHLVDGEMAAVTIG
jgi:hypothetical protein